MTSRIKAHLAFLLVLAACGGNPFLVPEPEVPPNPDALPGTTTPSPNSAITRYEKFDSASGNGYAEGVAYDAVSDTFSVDNLGFDGANAYSRGVAVANLGSYRVYEAAPLVTDPLTGMPIRQFEHRLLAGVSPTGNTEFAIVRTGEYVGYGFGGFVMRRNAAVNLPSTGQAAYSGDYAALRDFKGKVPGQNGLELATGDMTVAIDFRDFNDGRAVQGTISNRQIFDVNGNNITGSVLSALDDKFDPNDVVGPSTTLPILQFKVGPGVIDANGELLGGLNSVIADYSGTLPTGAVYEDGKYYGIISGNNAEEIVGIVVVESEDPRYDGVTARETGGFILYRP